MGIVFVIVRDGHLFVKVRNGHCFFKFRDGHCFINEIFQNYQNLQTNLQLEKLTNNKQTN